MAWLSLLFAGFFEIVWAFSMKFSQGFSRPIPTIITLVSMVISFLLLAFSMRTLPLGTAYTIWTGIGALGAFVVGIYIFGEPTSPMRLTAAVFILVGLVMMKLS